MKSKSSFLTLMLLTLSCNFFAQNADKIIDVRDGKTYPVTKINNQTWMAENLAFKTDNGCFAYDNDTSNILKYGCLYYLETAKNICPAGWHLPTDTEWDLLDSYLGFTGATANKLKSLKGWLGENEQSTNESGFTALPGGFLSFNGKFNNEGNSGYWWCFPEHNSDKSTYRFIDNRYNSLQGTSSVKKYAFSVRCVKD